MPAVPNVLLANANGEDVVEENLATLGLKSRVSEDLTPLGRYEYLM